MSRHAGEDDPEATGPEPGLTSQVVAVGVGHDCGADAVERSLVRQELLAGRVLLRRSRLQDDAPRQAAVELTIEGRQCEEGAERLGAHDVVAAAVPDPRQGVVLAEDRDGGDLVAVGGRTDLSAQCGLQPEDAVVMRDAVTIQEGPNRRHGVMLVPPGLRMVVDVVGQLQQLGAQVLEQPAEALAPLGRGALAGLESRRRGQNGRPLLRLGAHVLGVSRRRGGRQSGTRTRP